MRAKGLSGLHNARAGVALFRSPLFVRFLCQNPVPAWARSGRQSNRMANADLWRTLKNEFRGLSDYEHRLVPDPADSRRLSAYGDYTGGNATGQWHVSDGVSPDLRTWFEDLATRAGSELNIPPGVEALLFWLHCLAKFLADHESPYRDSGYLAVWDPRRVAIVREPAAASAVYCSYLAKESAAGQVAGSF